jgi:hypothetical protein
MTDRPTLRDHTTSYSLSAVTLGGRRLGPGTALVDDDVLRLLLLDSPSGEKSLQIQHNSILGAAIGHGSVIISCRDNRSLVLTTREANALRSRLLAACRALPEVTRTLRALGSNRGSRRTSRDAGPDEARFFSPLIEARRDSMQARDAQSVIGAFDAQRLRHEIEVVLAEFADRGAGGHPARRRAIEAEMSDDAEVLMSALSDLGEASTLAAADVDDLACWRGWAASVQRVFEVADRVWTTISPLMER